MGKTVSGGASAGGRARSGGGGSSFDASSFSDTSEASMSSQFAPALSALNATERTFLKDYTGSGYYVNKILREEGFDPGKFPSSGMTQKVNALDSALKQGQLTESIKLYRGLSSSQLEAGFAAGAIKPGMTITDPGFMSTSINGKNAFSGNIRYNLFAPAGTKGLYVQDISQHSGEREFLLPRNTTIRVLKIEKSSAGKWIVDAVIVP